MAQTGPPWPDQRVFRGRFADLARDIAATAEAVGLTYELLADDLPSSDPRRKRLHCRAQAEVVEARRLWDLAQELDRYDALSGRGSSA